ncbi:unnamed protein product [Orchesella dallaii]|uniref:C2H2-type domain-containing protein n=1 Tax=Orchesella dallaii TaxID=48710 RepID=A0ABP1SAG5_9HEXA
MVRDKHPTLIKTCIICRQKLTHPLKLNGYPEEEVGDDVNKKNHEAKSITQWKAMCAESLCMLFGLPDNHPLVSVFVNTETSCGKLCSPCLEDVSKVQHIFWQLHCMERRLDKFQIDILGRLRCNYEHVPVPTVFARIGAQDLVGNFRNLKYDEVVKIMFETLKDSKDSWPKPVYSGRWRKACDNAENLTTGQEAKPQLLTEVSTETESSIIVVKTESQQEVDGIFNISVDHDYYNPISEDTTQKVDMGEEKETEILKIGSDNEDDPAYEDPLIPGEDGGGGSDCDWENEKKVVTKKRRRKTRNPVTVIKKVKPKKAAKSEDQKTRYLCVEDPQVCNRTYSARKHLRSHIQSFHRDRTHACDYEGCAEKFASEDKLQRHKDRVHEKFKKRKSVEICETCGVEVARGDMKRHFYMRHVGVGQYSCDRCSLDFNDVELFKQHEQLHEQSEFPFSCVVCYHLFTNSLDLKSHVTSNHLLSGLKCSVCGIMKANSFLLERHMKIHERTKRFVCDCGKSFASKGYLNYHLEHFHNNADKQYPCSVCGKLFRHMKNVLRHQITHSDSKPYQCKICSKTFNYSHLLKKHEEIHSGTKNYGCEICGKRFRQEQNLTQHMKSHRPKSDRPGKKRATKEPVNAVDVSESVGLVIQTVDDQMKTEIGQVEEHILGTTTLEIVPGSVISTTDELHSTIQFETSQVQLHPNHQTQGTTTATVVFVSADQNLQWLQYPKL